MRSMLATVALLALTSVGAGGALAQDTPEPQVVSHPSLAQLHAAYPPSAMARGIAGHVSLKCTANRNGSLEGCVVSSEEPADESFGAAAFSLAPDFVIRPKTVKGQPVDANIAVHLHFLRNMPASGPGIVSFPDYLRTPTRAELEKSYPVALLRAHLGGVARLQCEISERGNVEKCHVLSENPAGFGVGEAAIALTSYMLARPELIDGQPVGGVTFLIPVRFVPPAPR